MKKAIGMFIVAALGAVLGVTIWKQFDTPEVYYNINAPADYQLTSEKEVTTPAVTETPNFVAASSAATPAVVHIKSFYEAKTSSGSRSNNPWEEFFGDGLGRGRQGQAAGSGVIIGEDGMIVTNNHVIEDADKVEVILSNKRSYIAEVLGTDPTTDIALLQIEEDGLPYLEFTNSDDVQIGEWVLAVGNPFNLTSTVTAGIVSAKGRSLNLLNEDFAIESFIQTDAAVNPGNSGGALINTQGQLVGINTAIASRTGSYAGYSFAVPANLVAKVTKDLEEYGQVQRAIIGVQIQNIDAKMAEKEDLATLNGAYVSRIIPGGAAEKSGIEPGDVITAVNGVAVNSSSELQEEIATYRPGDQVMVSLYRDGKKKNIPVELRNREGNTKLVKKEKVEKEKEADNTTIANLLGAEVKPLSDRERGILGVRNGVKVVKITDNDLKEAGIEPGYVILKVNKQSVDSAEDVQKILAESQGRILLEGMDKDGYRMNYSLGY